MADEPETDNEETGSDRRNFLKAAVVGVAGAAGATRNKVSNL